MLGKLSSILIPGIGEHHLLFASLIIESGKNCPPVTGHSWYTLKRDFMGFPQPWRKQQCQQCQQVTAELRLAGPAFSGDLVASFRRPPGLWGPGVYWTSWTPQNMAVLCCLHISFHGEMIKNFLDFEGGSQDFTHTLWWTNIAMERSTIFPWGKSTISMAIFHCYVSSPEG